MQQSTVNERGERVIPATKRPDGTWRKEKKVRAGYTPQDEQPVYQSTGTMIKNSPLACPGWDGQVESKAASVSKSAKKNEKRKQKRLTEQEQADEAALERLDEVLDATSKLSVSEPAKLLDAQAILNKQLKATLKKVRQCDALLERQKQGQALSPQEEEKLAKLPGWQVEVEKLDLQLKELAQPS